jgi:hypothetical protein
MAKFYFIAAFYENAIKDCPVAFRFPYEEVSKEVFMDKLFDCTNELRRKKEACDCPQATYELVLQKLNAGDEIAIGTTIFKCEDSLPRTIS